MKRHELEQYRFLEIEIKQYEERLESLDGSKSNSSAGGGSSGGHQTSITEKQGIERAEISTILDGLKAQAEAAKLRIVKHIAELDDAQMRIIIYRRCYMLEKWDQVAAYIGGEMTADTVSKIFRRAYPFE